jgi:hypothetical protein
MGHTYVPGTTVCSTCGFILPEEFWNAALTPELIDYAKSMWVTADVMLPSIAAKLGNSTTPSPGSYRGISIMLAICVVNLMKRYPDLVERKAKELMIVILEDWHQIDKSTGSRLRAE